MKPLKIETNGNIDTGKAINKLVSAEPTSSTKPLS